MPWTHPHIAVRKEIVKFDSNSGRVIFADGSYLDDVDHIVFGTGYTFSFPFLPGLQQNVKRQYRRLPGVYQHTWSIDDPTLAFVGMVSST